MKVVPPRQPLSAFDQIVGMFPNTAHALRECTCRDSERSPPFLVRHVGQEDVAERDDAIDDHVVHGTKIHDEVGLLWNKSVLAHETHQAACEVTSFEFIPG